MGLSFLLDQFNTKAVRKGIKRADVDAGNQPRLRRPPTWKMTEGMEGGAAGLGFGGRLVRIGLALSYVLVIGELELFFEDRGGSATCTA